MEGAQLVGVQLEVHRDLVGDGHLVAARRRDRAAGRRVAVVGRAGRVGLLVGRVEEQAVEEPVEEQGAAGGHRLLEVGTLERPSAVADAVLVAGGLLQRRRHRGDERQQEDQDRRRGQPHPAAPAGQAHPPAPVRRPAGALPTGLGTLARPGPGERRRGAEVVLDVGVEWVLGTVAQGVLPRSRGVGVGVLGRDDVSRPCPSACRRGGSSACSSTPRRRGRPARRRGPGASTGRWSPSPARR